AVSIHAVFAASSLGGSAAHASGACAVRRTSSHFRGKADLEASMHSSRWYAYSRCTAAPEGSIPLQWRDVLGVEAESPFPAVGEPVLQSCADRAKGDRLPGDLFLIEEGHLEGLFTGLEAEVQQPAEVEEVHLIRPRDRDHAEG